MPAAQVRHRRDPTEPSRIGPSNPRPIAPRWSQVAPRDRRARYIALDMRRTAPLVLIALLVACSGCAHRRRPESVVPDTRPIVTAVRIEGNAAFDKASIRAALGQQATPPWHFVPLLNFVVPAVRLEGDTWAEDRARIANFYAARGYFDARVSSSSVRPGKRRRKDGTSYFVTVQHQIQEGAPSRLRKVDVVLPGPDAFVAEARRVVRLAAGQRFDLAAAEEAKDAVLAFLQSRGYAFAEVAIRLDAYPEDQGVDVVIEATPGRLATFGEVAVRGLHSIAEAELRRRVAIRAGAAWDGAAIRETQTAIYGLGIFSMVTVTPDVAGATEVDGQLRVPIDVTVREQKPRTVDWGAGVGWQIGRFDVHGNIQLAHHNLFRRLVRARIGLEGGFAYLSPEDLGPVGQFEADIHWPDFPVRTLSLHGKVAVDLRVEPGFQLWSPSLDVGLGFQPWKPLRFDISYVLAYYDLFPQARVDVLNTTQQLEYPDGYLLPTLRQSLSLDLRDQPLAASQGFFGAVTVDEAGGPLGGQYRFIKVDGELRGYVPLGTERLVLAMRAGASRLFTWGDRREIPPGQRLFAGGDGSVRGWKSRYLGPRTLRANCDRRDCILPVGGAVAMSGSVELRGNIAGPFWIAAFLDVGRAWDREEDVPWAGGAFLRELQPGIGGGVRLHTPIGRVRLDLGFHPRAWTAEEFLGPTQVWKGKEIVPQLWNLHLGIGESF